MLKNKRCRSISRYAVACLAAGSAWAELIDFDKIRAVPPAQGEIRLETGGGIAHEAAEGAARNVSSVEGARAAARAATREYMREHAGEEGGKKGNTDTTVNDKRSVRWIGNYRELNSRPGRYGYDIKCGNGSTATIYLDKDGWYRRGSMQLYDDSIAPATMSVQEAAAAWCG